MKKIYLALALAAVLAGGYYTTRKILNGKNSSETELVSGESGQKKFSEIDYPQNSETEKSFRRGVEYAENDLKNGDVKLYRFGIPDEKISLLKKVFSSELGIQIEEWGANAGADERAFMKGYNSTVEHHVEQIFGGDVWAMMQDEIKNFSEKENFSELDK